MNKPIYAQIVLESKETINLELFYDQAPLTVDHFVKLVKKGYYKRTIFHRVIQDFMIQTGGYTIDNHTLNELPETEPIYGEFSENGWDKNNILHELGVISMARTQDMNSATSQFFLCSTTCEWLDTDTKSNEIIVKISNVETYVPHYAFQNFPVESVMIENIYISSEKFK